MLRLGFIHAVARAPAAAGAFVGMVPEVDGVHGRQHVGPVAHDVSWTTIQQQGIQCCRQRRNRWRRKSTSPQALAVTPQGNRDCASGQSGLEGFVFPAGRTPRESIWSPAGPPGSKPLRDVASTQRGRSEASRGWLYVEARGLRESQHRRPHRAVGWPLSRPVGVGEAFVGFALGPSRGQKPGKRASGASRTKIRAATRRSGSRAPGFMVK